MKIYLLFLTIFVFLFFIMTPHSYAKTKVLVQAITVATTAPATIPPTKTPTPTTVVTTKPTIAPTIPPTIQPTAIPTTPLITQPPQILPTVVPTAAPVVNIIATPTNTPTPVLPILRNIQSVPTISPTLKKQVAGIKVFKFIQPPMNFFAQQLPKSFYGNEQTLSARGTASLLMLSLLLFAAGLYILHPAFFSQFLSRIRHTRS